MKLCLNLLFLVSQVEGIQNQQVGQVEGGQTALERLASAVSALQSKGISDGQSAEQALQEMQSSSDEASLEPPKHLLPPGVDSHYHIKVSLEHL